MKHLKGIILVSELVLGFALPGYMWVLGVIASPFMIAGFVTGGDISLGISLGAVVCGGFGMWGILQLTTKVVSPQSKVTPPKRLIIYVFLGYVALALAIALLGFDPEGFIFIFAPPLVVSAQLLFMARQYLKGAVNNTLQPTASGGG